MFTFIELKSTLLTTNLNYKKPSKPKFLFVFCLFICLSCCGFFFQGNAQSFKKTEVKFLECLGIKAFIRNALL